MSNGADTPNRDEVAYWNDDAGSRWVEFQERIDRAFAPLSAAGLALAAAQPGESVVDIGCGCGATVLELADAVGSSGSVLGVDVSRSMLALAGQRAGERLPNVRLHVADAATHAFDESSVDLAFSRFGVMFFDDPVSALANVRRALRPGGRLVFVCWRDLAANPWFHVPLEAVHPHLPPQPKVHPHAPGPLAFADRDRVEDILRQAGYDDVRSSAFDAVLELGPEPQATELLSQIGPTSRLFAGGDEAARAVAREALSVALRGHAPDGHVRLRAGVWMVVARRHA